MADRVNGYYGWRPDKPDIRDSKLMLPRRVGPLPKQADLRGGFGPIQDQGDLGSCTAHAIGGAMTYDKIKQGKKHPLNPSRLFIYYNERVIEGTVNEDAGAELRDGMKAIVKWGAPTERLWPYVIDHFTRKPPGNVYKAGTLHQCLRYHRVEGANELALLGALQSCLGLREFPVVFGFTVYDSFESDAVSQTGTVPLPDTREGVLGGHAVALAGYNDSEHRFIVRNSWGTDWGTKGYFTMPYDYVLNPDLATDFWVMEQVE